MSKKETEVVIKDVVLKIGGREIKLTIEEARKLKIALEGIFGKEVVKETKVIHEHEYGPLHPFNWPIYPHQKNDWYQDIYKVTCYAGEIKGTDFKAHNTMYLELKD